MVMLCSLVHVMLCSLVHVMLCSLVHVMLCSLVHVMLCSLVHVMLCSLVRGYESSGDIYHFHLQCVSIWPDSVLHRGWWRHTFPQNIGNHLEDYTASQPEDNDPLLRQFSDHQLTLRTLATGPVKVVIKKFSLVQVYVACISYKRNLYIKKRMT
jgi:hypothetical protein